MRFYEDSKYMMGEHRSAVAEQRKGWRFPSPWVELETLPLHTHSTFIYLPQCYFVFQNLVCKSLDKGSLQLTFKH